METKERNYNGVTVEKSWSFVAFAKEFGTPKLATCKNSDGETFKSIAFDKDGDITFCHFGYSTDGMSAAEIVAQKDTLKVGLNTNGKYTLYKQSENAWETLDGIL